MDASIDKEIPGFMERIAVTSDVNGKVPEWMTTDIFTLCTFLVMTWPYRWVFNYNTGKTTYEIKKKIFAFPRPSPENNFTNNSGYNQPSFPPNYPLASNYTDNAPNYPLNYPDNPPNYPFETFNYPPPNYDKEYPKNPSNYRPSISDNHDATQAPSIYQWVEIKVQN